MQHCAPKIIAHSNTHSLLAYSSTQKRRLRKHTHITLSICFMNLFHMRLRARTHLLFLTLSLSLAHTRHTSSCPESLVFQHLINCLVIQVHTYFSIFAVLLTCCCRFTTKFSFITCQLPHTRTRMRLAKTIHKK